MADQLQPLDKVLPEDIARTFEAAVNVFQGKTEHMDDLLKNGGTLLRKVSKKFSPTQLVLTVAALAVVSIFAIHRATEE
jgi:recombination associated protein RdgC